MSDEEVRFYESHSEMEEELIQINDYSEFTNYYQNSISENIKHLGFAIYYPESKGVFSIDKIKLDPKHCSGKNTGTILMDGDKSLCIWMYGNPITK